MKYKYIKYIINTLVCRFSKHFDIKYSLVKYIIYRIQGINNIIKIHNSKVTKTSFSFS